MIIGMKRDYRNTIGKRIRLLRQDMKIQQNELAETIGMTQSHLSQIERGVKRPTAPSLAKIAKALGTTVDYLLMLEDDEQREPEPEPIGYSEQAEEAARLIDAAPNTYTRDLCLALVRVVIDYETQSIRANSEKVAGMFAMGVLKRETTDELLDLISGKTGGDHAGVLHALAKERA